MTLTVLLLVSSAYGALITLPYTYVNGQVLTATELNQDFQTIYNDYNGNITNANLSATAAIALSKLGLNPGQPALDLQTTGFNCWGSGLTTDTDPRCVMTSDGRLDFGVGGTTAPDVGFLHTATNTVQLNNGASGSANLDMNNGNIINGNFSIPELQGLRVSISSSSGLPADGTNTTIYAVPYTSGYIALYNASNVWVTDVVATNLSIAVPATTNTAYDVYIYDSSGTPTIGLAAWTGSTPPTRGTQNGVPYTNNSVYDRWIGSIATNGTSGTIEDDGGNRLVWNYNNRVPRTLFAQVPVSTWTYNSNTWRASDGNSSYGQARFGMLCGQANASVTATFMSSISGNAENFAFGMNADSTTAAPTTFIQNDITTNSTIPMQNTFTLGAGIHYITMMEAGNSVNTATMTGNPSFTNGSIGQSWMTGQVIQ